MGQHRRHIWGKEGVWESYTTITTTVAAAPTISTTTAAAQTDLVHCPITIQHEDGSLLRYNDVSSGKGLYSFIFMVLQSFSVSRNNCPLTQCHNPSDFSNIAAKSSSLEKMLRPEHFEDWLSLSVGSINLLKPTG